MNQDPEIVTLGTDDANAVAEMLAAIRAPHLPPTIPPVAQPVPGTSLLDSTDVDGGVTYELLNPNGNVEDRYDTSGPDGNLKPVPTPEQIAQAQATGRRMAKWLIKEQKRKAKNAERLNAKKRKAKKRKAISDVSRRKNRS